MWAAPRQPMLIVQNLAKRFTLKDGTAIRAVDDVSFDLLKGETLGVVGESGCGKSTTARLLIHLVRPDAGTLVFDGEEVGAMRGVSLRDLRRNMQMVFQDSHASLNPRLTLEDTIAFGPRVVGAGGVASRARAAAALDMVGLAPARFADRYPHELSGGQRQRVNIARALAMEPRVVILDEAVSALDKSVEAQILNLLQDLKARLSLTFLFISHDLNVVRFISDRVLVMYLGKVVEVGPVDALYERPSHPYTRALLASAPSMNPRVRRSAPPLQGDPPSPVDPPSGLPLPHPLPACGGGLRRHRAAIVRSARRGPSRRLPCGDAGLGPQPGGRPLSALARLHEGALPSGGDAPFVEAEALTVDLHTPGGPLRLLHGVSFALAEGETLCLIGESGSGKSVTMRALMRLLPQHARIGGRVAIGGADVASLSARDLRRARGSLMAMVFQEPATAFDPSFTVGAQIGETLRVHEGLSKGRGAPARARHAGACAGSLRRAAA